MPKVVVDGVGGDEEFLCDLAVRAAVAGESGDGEFGCREGRPSELGSLRSHDTATYTDSSKPAAYSSAVGVCASVGVDGERLIEGLDRLAY